MPNPNQTDIENQEDSYQRPWYFDPKQLIKGGLALLGLAALGSAAYLASNLFRSRGESKVEKKELDEDNKFAGFFPHNNSTVTLFSNGKALKTPFTMIGPRTTTGIITFQAAGDPLLVATGGTDIDIACSNGADTCLVAWYRDVNISTRSFDTNFKILGNETGFSARPESGFQVTDLNNGGYGLAFNRVSGYDIHLYTRMFNVQGVKTLDIDLGRIWSNSKPSVTSYTYGFSVESDLSASRHRNVISVRNDGTYDATIIVDLEYCTKGALSSRGSIIADVFNNGTNTLTTKFVHMDTRIVSDGYTVPLNYSRITLGSSQSVAFGKLNEFLVATDGIEGTESKIYVLSGNTNSTFFNNCNYREPYIIPNINMGPVETTYIGCDSKGRSLYDVTFRDISSNAVGVRCWHDKGLDQPQCSPIETLTSIPSVRKTSSAVTQDGELVRGFRTSADEIWLQKYKCLPVSCAKTPEDASYPSGWSNSNQELSSTTEPNDGSNIATIVGPLLALGLFGAAGCTTVYGVHRCRKSKSKKDLKLQSEKDLESQIELMQILKQTEIDPNRVIIESLLGKGGYGKVFRGKYEHLDVAIKMISLAYIEQKEIPTYLREVESMKQAQHHNVVQLIGAYQEEHPVEGSVLCIVMELMKGGTLKDKLNNNIAFSLRIKYIMDAALALRDTHKHNVVHRDIKTDNIFLDEKCETIKLGDFGVSKIIASDQTQTKQAIGTPIYMAPELISLKKGADRSCSKESDVYSFGLLIYAILTGKEPYHDCDGDFEVYGAKDRGELPKIPEDCYFPQEMVDLFTWCCANDKNMRPTMNQVYDSLANYYKKLNADVNIGVQQTSVPSIQYGL